MDLHTRTRFSALVAILAILLVTLVQPSTASSVAYCSSQNTGSDNPKLHSTWQSNGFCNTNCKDSHPFGVILGSNCWCSDYIPAEQDDVSECSDTCDGWQTDQCGNESKGLYIYIRLDSDAEIKGTQGSSQPTSSSVSPSSSANPVASSEAPSSSEAMTSKPVPASTTLKTTTAAPTSSQAPADVTTDMSTETTPFTSIVIWTESGVIVTKTVVTTPTSAPVVAGTQKKGTNTGAIVGGVVGGLAVLGAVVGAVVFLLFRRRRQQKQEEEHSGMQRNTSTMSRSGLLGRAEKAPQQPPNIATTFNSRHSRHLDNESISPISGSDRRSSRLVFDQRLNPNALMVLDNPSRDSFVSMDDSRDYGRTLNVRNPDPDNH